MTSATMASPAKLNLSLAITGRRADGYHDLVSAVAPLAWGDTLHVRRGAGVFTLVCDDPAVPLDESNLILRAARAFQAATGETQGAAFVLEKRIPMGAGLGGGSSNAVAALRALNLLSGTPLDAAALRRLAAQLGSDCPFFLEDGPAVIRGRGEDVIRLDSGAARRLTGRRALVFKPGFGIATAWAYGQLAANKGQVRSNKGQVSYTPRGEAERSLAAWLADSSAPVEKLLFNGFERVAFRKFPAIPLLLERLRQDFGLEPHMSGSGSACFALLADEGAPDTAVISAVIREEWGPSALVVETRLA